MDIKASGNAAIVKNKALTKKLSPEDIAQRVAGKFGNKASIKKAAPAPAVDTKVELNSKETITHSDVGSNNPASELTKEKLRGLLKGGGFDFNGKERKALAEILK